MAFRSELMQTANQQGSALAAYDRVTYMADPLQMTTCAGPLVNDRDQRAMLRYYEDLAKQRNAQVGVSGINWRVPPEDKETPRSSKTLLLLNR